MTTLFSPPRPVISDSYIRSFGRVMGRTLTPGQRELVETVLPRYAVDMQGEVAEPAMLFDFRPEKIWLEIGFGGGEHLVTQATNHPGIGIIGCEPFINGVVSLLRQIEQSAPDNVKIMHGDARLLVDKLPDNSLDRIFILFPDPWPKVKHHKKRIISKHTLDMLARVLKNDGWLDIATDHVDYAMWIEEQLAAHPLFAEGEGCKDRSIAPQGWVQTRYQQKALKQGRKAVFFRAFPV